MPGSGYYMNRITELQYALEQKKTEWRRELQNNSALKRKEQALFGMINALGENLHCSGLRLSLSDQAGFSTNPLSKEMVDSCLAQDVQVHALLLEVRPSEAPAHEQYTARLFRSSAITPELLATLSSATPTDHILTFRNLTMRLSYLMFAQQQPQQPQESSLRPALSELHIKQEPIELQQTSETAGGEAVCSTSLTPARSAAAATDPLGQLQRQCSRQLVLSQRLEDVVDQYCQYTILQGALSVKCVQRLCSLNFDTMEPHTPPEGWWQDVVDAMQLQQDQMELLSTAYAVYDSKIKPLIVSTQQLAAKIQEVLLAGDSCSNTVAEGGAYPLEAAGDGTVGAKGPALSATSVEAESSNSRPPCRSSDNSSGNNSNSRDTLTSGDDGSGSNSNDNNCRCDNSSSGNNSGAVVKSSSSADTSDGPVQVLLPSRASRCRRARPWINLGLPSTGLDLEAAEQLAGVLQEMHCNLNKMSQLSHSLTFPCLDTLSQQQLAQMVVHSYPYMPDVCQICERIWSSVDAMPAV